MQELTLHSDNEETSLDLGRRIGETLEPGDVLALWGELGAGKTLLTRGIARGLSIPPEIPITSPTFTFINEYEGRLHLYHLDLYRLTDLDELETLPWREALFGTGAAVIEWPERLGEWLPEERFDIRISITGEESRKITLTAHGERKRNQHRIFRSFLLNT
jgi:tRNA threonylcarbamoyladenosine biosynthesis protein TsaE